MKALSFAIILMVSALSLRAQMAFLKMATPLKEQITVNASRQYITGATCNTCKIKINDSLVYVWPTGAFVYQLDLRPGDTSFLIKSIDPKGKSVQKTISYSYPLPEKERTNETLVASYLKIYPEGDLMLQPGDRIRITLKTLPGCEVKMENDFVLSEIIPADTVSVRGIYKGEYVVKENDEYLKEKKQFRFIVRSVSGDELQVTSKSNYELMKTVPLVLQTKGQLPFLLEGLGEDRLGGTKIGYLDSLIKLEATGKIGTKYRVRLARNHEAYIEEQYVDVLNNGSFSPSSLTHNMRAWGDSLYDYVSLTLFDRLPYKTLHELNPSRIIVDVYGATANTNWITQLQSLKEIKNVYYTQAEDDVFRVTIELGHDQHWGHAIYYNGTTLIIRVKKQPPVLELNKLVIGVDAGHGGTNTGASGALGINEKEITLLMAKQLKMALEKEGATVIMTRTKDTTYDNLDRILLYRKVKPDIVISLHLNSHADPIRVMGTSTYYKYIGFRPLTQFILKRMLELGLSDYGNIGNFNFMLNSPIEYPNVLVETLFISHPADEAKAMNEDFRKQLSDKIVAGIKDWLRSCSK